MARPKSPFALTHLDPQERYDVYFETANKLVALRDVRILGLRTWAPLDDPDEVEDRFLALQNADGGLICVEAEAVTMLTVAGTQIALDPVA